MSEISPSEAARLSDTAAAALRRNDPIAARRHFQQLVGARPADADAWIGLALASRGMGDETGARAAIDKALAVQPNHLRGLVMKADSVALAGDGRAAHAFYSAAVARAPAIESLSAEM
ncbi:MAG: tetratricopeptide repeat protein, partial [Caulobacteraceae bacterium]